MANRPVPQKNKNALNLFLNEYFQAIIVVVLILFLGLAYFIFLGPRFSIAQETIRTNIDNEKSLYANNLKKLESYKAISEIYKKIDPGDLRRFNTVLPDNYVPERLYGEVEEIISRGGWIVGSVIIKRPEGAETAAEAAAEAVTATSSTLTTGENLGQYTLELTITSIDYAGFKTLLKTLENNLRLFDVSNISFSPSNGSAKITLVTYYYKRTQ